MADKIANFEDYKKRDARQEESVKEKEAAPRINAPKDEKAKAPVPQETMNIEIEDPYQFLNEEEREEYILERQKEMQRQERSEEAEDVRTEPEQRREREPERPRPQRRQRPVQRPEYEEEEYEPEEDEEFDQEYDEDAGDEEGQEKDDRNILLLVRVASVITGLIILFFIGMLLKTKVFDRYLAPDPDEAPATATVALAIPAGFTEKNDTVVVTGASFLNLRSGPDTGSTVMGQAAEGTELKRIAVAEDGSWALVEFEGQQVYAAMKYLKEK